MTEETPEEKTVREMMEKKEADEKEAAKVAQEDAAAEDEKIQKAVNASDDKITQANAAAMRIEGANKEQKALLDRQEAMHVEGILGGTAEAGAVEKKETPEEYAKKVMANDVDAPE